MTPGEDSATGPDRDRLGLTNGNGALRPRHLTIVLGHVNGKGLTNGLGHVNGTGLTNGRGATNGLVTMVGRVNGMGRVNGVGRTNGIGRTNGRGRVNGLLHARGATNGTGVINGLFNGTVRKGIRRNPFGVVSQRDLRIGVGLVVLALLLLAPVCLLLVPPRTPVPACLVPDGDLADWYSAGIGFIGDAASSPEANIALHNYSAFEEDGRLCFAVNVNGLALGDNAGLDGFHVFIDQDRDPNTGFEVREIGADYMVEVIGGNNSVSDASLYGFGAGTGSRNWSRWERTAGAAAATSKDVLEVRLSSDDVEFDPDHRQTPVFLVQASDFAGNETTASVHFNLSLRALLVTQDAVGPVVAASGDAFASLTFRAFGDEVDVMGVSLEKFRGPGSLGTLGAFTVTEANPVTRTIPVTFTTPGDYVVARLTPALVQVGDAVPTTIDGPDIVAYLGALPTGHRIDGYFGDWTQAAYDPGIVSDRNVDIQYYAANRTGSTAFVYADVEGRIFGGSASPNRIVPSTGGGGGQASPPGPSKLVTGEDVFRAYIDVDTSQATGFPILGVMADFCIDVRGIYGKVVSKQAYDWSAGDWVPSVRIVEVANDRSRMEASLDLSGVATGDMAMSIEATDWASVSDGTGVYNFLRGPATGGTRGGLSLDPMHGTSAATALAPPLSSAPTVDADCTDSVYSEAGTFSDTGISGKVGTFSLFVYICIDVTGDTTDDSTLDSGYIYFDTQHDGGGTPQTDDRRFNVRSDSTALGSMMGDGSTWAPCSSPECHSANQAEGAFMSGHEVYEFKVRFANVWGTDSPADGDRAGFAVRALDSTTATYTWGSTDPPDDASPDTWGHLDIPEFTDIVLPVAVVGVIYLVARRRRRDEDS